MQPSHATTQHDKMLALQAATRTPRCRLMLRSGQGTALKASEVTKHTQCHHSIRYDTRGGGHVSKLLQLNQQPRPYRPVCSTPTLVLLTALPGALPPGKAARRCFRKPSQNRPTYTQATPKHTGDLQHKQARCKVGRCYHHKHERAQQRSWLPKNTRGKNWQGVAEHKPGQHSSCQPAG